jgi:hypothetical protein
MRRFGDDVSLVTVVKDRATRQFVLNEYGYHRDDDEKRPISELIHAWDTADRRGLARIWCYPPPASSRVRGSQRSIFQQGRFHRYWRHQRHCQVQAPHFLPAAFSPVSLLCTDSSCFTAI